MSPCSVGHVAFQPRPVFDTFPFTKWMEGQWKTALESHFCTDIQSVSLWMYPAASQCISGWMSVNAGETWLMRQVWSYLVWLHGPRRSGLSSGILQENLFRQRQKTEDGNKELEHDTDRSDEARQCVPPVEDRKEVWTMSCVQNLTCSVPHSVVHPPVLCCAALQRGSRVHFIRLSVRSGASCRLIEDTAETSR